jgi:aspartate racemase
VTDAARREVENSIAALAATGVQAIVLGCTELPFAVSPAATFPVPVLDPALLLARALVEAAAPGRGC